MEANRLWHDPVVGIYGNLVTPNVCCTAEAYDFANRRWYKHDVADPVVPDADWRHNTRLRQVPDDEWLSSIVESNVKAHYDSTKLAPPWNTISTNTSGSPVTYRSAEETSVRRPIFEKSYYGCGPSDKLPTIKFSELQNKSYLSGCADYCIWGGMKCVFKRIDFDPDVRMHKNEVRCREAIIRCIERDAKGGAPEGANQEMERRFNVVPILAVVLHDETSKWILSRRATDDSVPRDGGSMNDDYLVAGFLMPYAGPTLDLYGTTTKVDESERISSPTLPAAANVPIIEEQLLDLAYGVRNLSKCAITHGDLRYWNVILKQPDSVATTQVGKLLLIDMGTSGNDYTNDMDALGTFFLWCLEHSTKLRENPDTKRRVATAAALLKEEGDIDRAIGVLSPGNTRSGSGDHA